MWRGTSDCGRRLPILRAHLVGLVVHLAGEDAVDVIVWRRVLAESRAGPTGMVPRCLAGNSVSWKHWTISPTLW